MDRNKCYCSIREKEPDYYKKQGIPDGYCALCSICKKPGHACHVPAPLPYTGGWCDEHYRLIADAFTQNFTDGKVRKYFKLKGVQNPAYIEVIGDMLFRVVIDKDNKLTRYKHGNIKAGIEVWIEPISTWKIRPTKEISENQFDKFWQDAVDADNVRQFTENVFKMGQEILKPIFSRYGFEYIENASGKSSGGYFKSGSFKKADRVFEFSYRDTLGCVKYSIGKFSLDHATYMKLLGVVDKARYPDFNKDPLQSFRELAYDLENFSGDFINGSGEDFKKLVNEFSKNPKVFKGLP